MTAASPVDLKVNPNNTAQRYILWGNGRIDNIGGAPAVTGQATWYTSAVQPIAVGLWITDWTTGAGYILDHSGGFHEFGGAPELGASGVVNGVPFQTTTYVDWSWDPAGSGKGLVLDAYGRIYAFGGANLPARTGPRWSWPAARRLKVKWSAGQPAGAVTMDLYGGLHGDYGTPSALAAGGYWPGWDAARDVVVVDWSTTTPKTQTLDLYGALHPAGGATKVFGFPYRPGADVARRVAVLSASDPASFWEVWSAGQQWDWTSSTAPTVVAGGDSGSPAATVTDTTRPTLAWSYSDPEKDSQAAARVMVFTETFAAAHDMTDPSSWAASALVDITVTDPARRGVVADVDFANGSYREYVRAQDTSGLWSAWDHLAWTQNIPAPATPTGLTAVADPAVFTVALSVSATTGGSADAVLFECSDDGGVTWAPVRGGEAVPLAATTTVTDYDIPLGVTRTYRATAFNDSPRVVSAASGMAAARIDRFEYVLASTVDPTRGGVVRVVDAPSWTRTVVAGVFEGVGAEFPTVVDDGSPKSRRQTLSLEADQRAEFDKVDGLLEVGGVLLLRDPFGAAIYCKVVGDVTPTQLRAGPDPSEVTPYRHLHRIQLPLVEVAQPTILPVASTVPPGPAAT